MVLLKKIRESLGVALALIAALSSAYGFITGLRNDSLMSEIKVVNANVTTLTGTNEVNAKAIQELIDQRVIDERLVRMLNNQFEQLAKHSQTVRAKLREIKSNDAEFQTLLSKRHPVELGSLLNERTNSGANKNNSVKASN